MVVMAIGVSEEVDLKRTCSFEDALDLTGFGKYNIMMLGTCCLLILAMYVDIFGFSILMPAVACDLALTTAQQGLLSAIPLIGVMISSYAWGLCADTLGRRSTLLIAMPVGMFFNFAASMSPNYATLCVLKFLSGAFTSSANAAAFVLLGETASRPYRSRFMFLMATTTMVAQLVMCVCALPIFRLSFRIEIYWMGLEYRPWRLLMQVLCIFGVLGTVFIALLQESPKFLLCKGSTDEAMHVLKFIHKCNTGKQNYPVEEVYMEDELQVIGSSTFFLRKMWSQTAPLFKPPLRSNSLKLYYMLLCAYMTSTGYTMWVPTMTNAYFDGEDATGQTFCDVASKSATVSNSKVTDCDNTIEPMALYATMVYSGVSGIVTILLSFLVGPLGKKKTTILVFSIATLCGIAVLFVRIPVLSVGLFFMFLYVALILGNVNTYLVELNPTHLRGMATCLSVVVARGFGFASVQVIAALLADHCTPMISGYIMLLISGLAVAFLLPAETKKKLPCDMPSEE